MRLVRTSALLAGTAIVALLAGCSGDEQPTGQPDSSKAPSFPRTTSTPADTTGSAPSSAAGGGTGTGGNNGGGTNSGIDDGTGSASKYLAFSVAMPAACSPQTVPQQNGSQCYKLGEELLSSPLVGNVSASQAQQDPAHWQVQFTLVSKFKDAFREITRKNVGKQLAITFQGKVLSAPRVQGEIPNGSVVIAGSFTKKQAQDLAAQLR